MAGLQDLDICDVCGPKPGELRDTRQTHFLCTMVRSHRTSLSLGAELNTRVRSRKTQEPA